MFTDNYERKGNPYALASGGVLFIDSSALVGFLCTASGTLSVRYIRDGAQVTLANVPVTAGNWVDIPISIPRRGHTEQWRISSSGGCAGTIVVQ